MGNRVRGRVLHETTELLVNGTQRALRLRTEGRSSARGHLPAWIEAAADVVLVIEKPRQSSAHAPTVLDIEVPTLAEAAPDTFRQTDLFPELDTSRTGLDYLIDSLSAVLSPNGDDALYDASFLEFLRKREPLFDAGISSMEFFVDGSDRPRTLLELTVGSLQQSRSLEGQIPPPQRVRIAGILDTIRASDLSFILALPDGTKVRGMAEDAELLQRHWKTTVVVSGRAFYTARRRIQRIEADNMAPATRQDLEISGATPLTEINLAQLRRPQGPRSGLAAIVGRWPGDEGDEVINQALHELS